MAMNMEIKFLGDTRKSVGDFELIDLVDETRIDEMRSALHVEAPTHIQWNNWEYGSEVEELRTLYEKGKNNQWSKGGNKGGKNNGGKGQGQWQQGKEHNGGKGAGKHDKYHFNGKSDQLLEDDRKGGKGGGKASGASGYAGSAGSLASQAGGSSAPSGDAQPP